LNKKSQVGKAEKGAVREGATTRKEPRKAWKDWVEVGKM